MAAYDITTASSILEYETQFGIYPAAVLMDANHVFLIFGGVGGDATVQMFTVNTSTWAITTAAAPKENGQIGYFNNAAKLDATHVLTVCGNGASKLAGVVGVNTSTWAVTIGSLLKFETANGRDSSLTQLDENHFICVYRGGAGADDTSAQVFAVNTSTFAVTTASSKFTVATDNGAAGENVHTFLIDATHVMVIWKGSDTGKGASQVLDVNTKTWAVTTAGALFKHNTTATGGSLGAEQIDSNHFIISYYLSGSTGGTTILEVSTSTWEVTTKVAAFDIGPGNLANELVKIDSTHFILFFQDADTDDAVAQVLTIDGSYKISTSSASLNFHTDMSTTYTLQSSLAIDSTHYVDFFSGNGDDGFAQVFYVEGGASGPANLKTLNTNAKSNIKTINTATIANTKTYNTIT